MSERRGGPVSREDLISATEDLYYEWSMLAHIFDLLQKYRPPDGRTQKSDEEQTAWNAWLASFGLHARTVLDFLRTRSADAGSNDVVAHDYVTSSAEHSWIVPLDDEKNFLDGERDEFNRGTAHIRRASKGGGRGRTFRYRRALAALTRSLHLFIEAIDDDLLHERWNDRVRMHLADQVWALDKLGD